jgi:peptidoglycan/LPS O-acetylase OafA/YrhL
MATAVLSSTTARPVTAPVLSFDGRGRLGHAHSIEGLRGVAVAAVVVYHLRPGWLPGGFLGVEMFFVLSGFLITSLLLSEIDATGQVRVWRFLLRRARRLLPAMFAMVAVTCVLTSTLSPDIELARARRHAIGTLTYSMNWRLIHERLSYTDLVAGQSPFRHMWSLAIEEQFYIGVAVLLGLTALCRVQLGSIRRSRMAMVSGLLAAVGACTMWVLASNPSRSNARAYYGTDTRAAGLLIGVALAALIANREIRVVSARVLCRVSAVGWAELAVSMWRLHEQSDVTFHGGIVLVSLATAAVIAGLQERTAARWLLERSPIRLLGRLSYSVYLWHWPVIIFVTPARTGLSGPWLDLLRVAIILAVSAISMVAIERPFRRSMPSWDRRFDNVLPLGLAAALIVAIVATRPPQAHTLQALPQPVLQTVPQTLPRPQTGPGAQPATDSVPSPTTPPTDAAAGLPPDIQRAVARESNAVIVGDSVAHTLAGGTVGAFPDYQPWSDSVSSFQGLSVRVQSLARPGCSFLPGYVARVGDDGSWTSVSLAGFCGDWEADLGSWLVPAKATDFVLLVLSNDLEDRAVDGRLVTFDSAEYDTMLTAFLDRLEDKVHTAGSTLVVVATPPRSDPPDTDKDGWREVRMRGLLQQYSSVQPAAKFVDLGTMVCPADDCSAPRNGFESTWRYDGLHFTADGARCAAKWISAQLTSPAQAVDPSWSCSAEIASAADFTGDAAILVAR